MPELISHTRSRSRTAITVYDPDGVNPYGRELAAVLTGGTDVTYVCPTKVDWLPSAVKACLPILCSSVQQEGFKTHAFRRFSGPVRVLMGALVRRRTLVIVWTRGIWDALLFSVFKAALPGLIVVNHNPAAIRGRPGPAGRAESYLKRTASLAVIHSARLRPAALRESKRVEVAEHPPYREWSRVFTVKKAHDTDHPTVAFVGALRSDKGVADFVSAICHTNRRPLTVTFVGRGHLNTEQESRLMAAGIDVVPPSVDFLDNQELGRRLAQVDLVVAPYRHVTQSGSVYLALSCGIGVAAYAVGGVQDILSDKSLVPAGDVEAMARTVDKFLSDPWESVRAGFDEIDRRCREQWYAILDAEGFSR